MRSPPVIIAKICVENTPQMPLVQNDHVIKDLSVVAVSEELNEGVLPGNLRSGDHMLEANVLDSPVKEGAVNTVAITEEIPWWLITGKRVDHLLCCPFRRGMRCDVDVHHPSPLVGEDHEHEEHLIGDRWHHKEVKGDQVFDVVLEEDLPRR